MIVAGVILLLLGYLLPLVLPVPLVLATVAIWLGWILLIIGVVLWLLGSVGRQPVGPRRHFGSVGSWPVGRRRHFGSVDDRQPVGPRRHFGFGRRSWPVGRRRDYW